MNTVTNPHHWVTIPSNSREPANYLNLDELPTYLKIAKFFFQDPLSFLYQLSSKLAKDSFDQTTLSVTPYVKKGFIESPEIFFMLHENIFFSFIQNSAPSFLLSVLESSRSALKLMISDLFEAFVMPLSETAAQGISKQTGLTFGTFAITLLTHEIALSKLKGDPKLAESITYGALVGILTSFIMDQDVRKGAIAGACTGVITDTALEIFTPNAIISFFKRQYKNFNVEERARKVQKLASQTFPYLTFALGTSLIYAQMKPILSKLIEGEEISSQKLYMIKTIALSGFLFGTIKSYSIPIFSFLYNQAASGIQTAQNIEKIFSWAPRVLTILYLSSFTKLNK